MAYGKKLVHIEKIKPVLDGLVQAQGDVEIELEDANEANRLLFKIRQAIYIARLNRDKHPEFEDYSKLNRYQFSVKENKVIGKYKGVSEVKIKDHWDPNSVADRIVKGKAESVNEPDNYEAKVAVRGMSNLMDIVEYLMDDLEGITHIQFPDASSQTLNVNSLNNWLKTRGWTIVNTLPIEVKKDGE